MTKAEEFVSMFQRKTEGMSLEELDNCEPWTWPHNVDSEDDNGEDWTSVFSDGSKARWTNRERSWEVVS